MSFCIIQNFIKEKTKQMKKFFKNWFDKIAEARLAQVKEMMRTRTFYWE